jgi:hypothetical protein
METFYEAWLSKPAQRFLDELPDDDAQAIRRLISLVEIDPHPDRQVKFVVDRPPVVLTVYIDERWWLLYHIPQNGRVAIVAIGPSWPAPGWFPRNRRAS